MTTEVIAVPTKRGRPKKAAISPLEPLPTAKNSKGRAAAAAAEAAPKAISQTKKKAEPAQPKEAIEIWERVDRDTKAQARSAKGKNSAGTRTPEHPAVASPPSTSSLAIQAVDVPTPPSLLEADPPPPALVPPHASTSTEPPQQGPLPQSKILTALAEELQLQAHRISPAASPEPIPSAIKLAPAPTRMARPSPRTAPRKPHSAPVPPPPQARKAPPLISLPSRSPPSTSPIPSAKLDKLKATSRKYTIVMVALPIAIVTSWALFERREFSVLSSPTYVPEGRGAYMQYRDEGTVTNFDSAGAVALGKEQKTLVRWPDAPAATSSTAGVEKTRELGG